MVPLIGRANAAVARFDGAVQAMVNPAVLMSPLADREAVLSSRIEGTQADLQDVLEFVATSEQSDPALRQDILEIRNYRRALDLGVAILEKKPLHLGLVLEIHRELMEGIRGHHSGRGRWRTVQNWIGAPGTPMEQADYVPPAPEQLAQLLDNFEAYLHLEERDRLVQVAVIHGQFELIHPFVDGNGRVGRILVPLFLYENQVTHSPTFYVSAYLEAHRSEYYAALRALSETEEWEPWLRFFLVAVTEQAESGVERIEAILALYERIKTQVASLTRSPHAVQSVDALFARPVFTVAQFAEEAGLTKATTQRHVSALTDAGTLDVVREPRGRRAGVYRFKQLMDLAAGQGAG